MAQQPEIAPDSVASVARELGATLTEARVALERYVDRRENPADLTTTAEQLHAAHGVLRMLEVYGGALLAEEMERLARYLAEHPEGHNEALEVLARAMVQLPPYLDRVFAGGRDMPLILLPMLNDLRSVRGSPLLSENTLFILNLSSSQLTGGSMPKLSPSRESMQQVARRCRPLYQAALLRWIRGLEVEANLVKLAEDRRERGPRPVDH